MKENLTDWQKIAAVFRQASGEPDISGQALDLAIGMKLAEMVEEDSDTVVAITGLRKESENGDSYQLGIITQGGNNYFLMFPNKETAEIAKANHSICKLKEVLSLMLNTPQMKGIQFVVDCNSETKRFFTCEITKGMAAIALNMKK